MFCGTTDGAMSDKPYVCVPDGYLEPRIGASGFAAKPATTVVAMFDATTKKHGTANAMALKRPVGGKVPDAWKFWTWSDYRADCIKFAKTLLHLGVDRWNVVNILGFNSVSPFTLFDMHGWRQLTPSYLFLSLLLAHTQNKK